jgi:hypothetical protein
MIDVAQALLAVAGLIFVTLGTLHGLLTLLDLGNPRAFTPTDASVRVAMQSARVAFNPRINLWQAWMGFNLSHSVGVVLAGGGLLFLAWPGFPAFVGSHLLQGIAAGVAAVYLVLSLRFWFWGPALGSGVALSCIVAAIVLAA